MLGPYYCTPQPSIGYGLIDEAYALALRLLSVCVMALAWTL